MVFLTFYSLQLHISITHKDQHSAEEPDIHNEPRKLNHIETQNSNEIPDKHVSEISNTNNDREKNEMDTDVQVNCDHTTRCNDETLYCAPNYTVDQLSDNTTEWHDNGAAKYYGKSESLVRI